MVVRHVLSLLMLLTAISILAGCNEELLQECITQVLYLLSCDTAIAVLQPDFARGRMSHHGGDVEHGMGPARRWRRTQLCAVISFVMVTDAAVVAYDRPTAASHLLVAGILVLWSARHMAKAQPSTTETALMTGLSTAILQTMMWQVSQPVALLLHIGKLRRVVYTLTATLFPIVKLLHCEVVVVLVGVVYETPQWLSVSMLILNRNPHR